MIYFFGAIILFSIGYVSVIVLGNDNVIEEIAEDALHDAYKIDVIFNSKK